MIFSRFLPQSTIASARRYWRFRRELNRLVDETPDAYPLGPLILYEASDPDWRTSSDQVIGGYSETKHEFIPDEDCIRWTGTVDTTVGFGRAEIQRSGFCALRAPSYPLGGADLQGYFDALEVTCRSTVPRDYTINLWVDSSLPDALYQGTLQPTEEFVAWTLPFEHFGMATMSRESDLVRRLEGTVCIEAIGITLMDGKDGDFELDLKQVRAVNFLDDKVFLGAKKMEV